jgi:hypothetical protein
MNNKENIEDFIAGMAFLIIVFGMLYFSLWVFSPG